MLKNYPPLSPASQHYDVDGDSITVLEHTPLVELLFITHNELKRGKNSILAGQSTVNCPERLEMKKKMLESFWQKI